MTKLSNYDWYCDECNDLLNNQPGFDANCGTWTCSKCGELNYISSDEILSDSEIDDFKSSGYDSYNDYKNSCESYDVYDAALAWQSRGYDEDYMFGYTEDELRSALNKD